MTREAKVGLMMVAVVVGVFGFLLYKRLHRPTEALAGQIVREDTHVANGNDRDFVDDRTSTQSFEDDAVPVKRQDRRSIGRKVELAAEKVEEFAEAAVEEVNPFSRGKRTREKPPMPVELTSSDDDFGQFQKTRVTRDEPQRMASPDPAEDAFDSAVQQRMSPPRTIPADDETTAADPFATGDSAPTVQPVQFDEPSRRERNVPNPDEAFDRNSSREFRASSNPPDAFAQTEEPRRPREFDAGFEAPSRARRRADPAPVFDDRPSNDSAFQTTGTVDGPTYVVQPNDSLWSISRKRYGAGRYYKALALHNQQTISDPKMMKPGVVISTPDAAVLEQRYADVIPKAAPVESTSSVSTTQSRKPAETEPSGYFVSQEGVPMYRVGELDTLTGIAKSHLGRTTRWVQILEMNRNVLRDGNELKIGMVLRLPADASRVQVVSTPRDVR